MSDWRLTTDNSVVVVVDVQERLMKVMPKRDPTIAAIRKLVDVAQILHVPVVVTLQYVKGLGPICSELEHAAGSTASIEKISFSCCGSEDFLTRLKEINRPRIILCGAEAHVCVLQTAIDLMARDRFVYLCADAVCSRREVDERVAIERIRDCGAVISTVESAAFELLREAGTAQFKQCLPLFK